MNIKNLAKIADALKHPVKDSSDAALNNLKQTAETLKAIKALGYSVGWTANRYGSDYIYLKGIGFNDDPPQDVASLWHKLESLVEKGTIMSEDILEDLGYHSSGNEGSYVKTNSSGDKASKTIKLSNRLNPLEALQKAGLLGSPVKDASNPSLILGLPREFWESTISRHGESFPDVLDYQVHREPEFVLVDIINENFNDAMGSTTSPEELHDVSEFPEYVRALNLSESPSLKKRAEKEFGVTIFETSSCGGIVCFYEDNEDLDLVGYYSGFTDKFNPA